MPFTFGKIYENDLEATLDQFSIQPNQEMLRDNNEIDANQKIERDAAKEDLPVMWDVADWFFDKPKAPQVAKPEIYKPEQPTLKDKLDDIDSQVLQQDQNTFRNIRRQRNYHTELLRPISDVKKEKPGEFLGQLDYEGPEMIDGITMVPYGRRNGDKIEQQRDPKEIMKDYPDSEGFTLDGNPYVFIRKPKPPALTSEADPDSITNLLRPVKT